MYSKRIKLWPKTTEIGFRPLLLIVYFTLFSTSMLPLNQVAQAQNSYTPSIIYNPGSGDQDDMGVWIHPTDRSKSVVIGSDKVDRKINVYDLDGTLKQSMDFSGVPGNIDIRYNFPFDGQLIDIVGVNQRKDQTRYLVYQVLRDGKLFHNPIGDFSTGDNYGSCLYQSPVSQKFYAILTSKSGFFEQYELDSSGNHVTAKLVRQWDGLSKTEACVADGENGVIFLGEENKAIWKVGGESNDPTPGEKIIEVDDKSGIDADIEGLTIYYTLDGRGYLIASSQENNEFIVYDRQEPHAHRATFRVTDAEGTDGMGLLRNEANSSF